MAGQSEVLKEYLMALGFRLDEKSTKVFDQTTNKFDKRVVGLAKSALAVGAAAQVMVTRFSRSMEQLYYSSRRAESTASNLQSIAFGASQIGIEGNGMKKSVEGLARSLRLNPGLSGLLKDLGVRVEGRDRSDVLLDMVEALRKMPHYQAAAYAGLFGIDADTLFMLDQGLEKLKASKALQEQMAREAGVDMNKASEAGLEYARILNEIKERASLLSSTMAMTMLPVFRTFAVELNTVIANLTRIIPLIKSPTDFVQRFALGFDRLTGADTLGWYNRNFGAGRPAASIQPGTSAAGGGRGFVNPALVNPGNLPLGLRQNNPGNLRSWGSTPVNNGFANFASSQEGLSAMAGNLLAYQRRGLTSLNKIIATWAPSSENNTAAYIRAVSKGTGFKPDELLNLSDPKTLTSLMASMIQHENGYNPFSSNELNAAAAGRLGVSPITIHNQTTIQITSPDPVTAGQQVADQQDRVSSNLVRNLGNAKVK